MTAYDPNNPFAKILRGEFPSYKVYADDHTLAFLDIMLRGLHHAENSARGDDGLRRRRHHYPAIQRTG
jgi:hypothetical protein